MEQRFNLDALAQNSSSPKVEGSWWRRVLVCSTFVISVFIMVILFSDAQEVSNQASEESIVDCPRPIKLNCPEGYYYFNIVFKNNGDEATNTNSFVCGTSIPTEDGCAATWGKSSCSKGEILEKKYCVKKGFKVDPVTECCVPHGQNDDDHNALRRVR